ncbi:uncharacterized protein LOC111253521 isoform X1 [Varroa destructor]|uniref:Gustatory receptor n=2 Tax=Varroa destructor TaxID=109461 RepID=A0A7M7KPE2_VARDE|nr:uncharacterized protein LOC111253521 isoform X1 [Varroa destructor]
MDITNRDNIQPLIGYECANMNSLQHDTVQSSLMGHLEQEQSIERQWKQIRDVEDFAHSSSNSYIRYGANIVHQVPYHHDQVSTSVVLRFCRTRVLRSYCRLLAAVGWKPLLGDGTMRYDALRKVINMVYVLAVIGLILGGHIITIKTYYRRDAMRNTRCREFQLSTVRNGEPERCSLYLFSVFILPATVHFIAFMIMLVQMRSQDSEEITALVERVFLQTTSVWQIARRKIQKRLKAVYLLGLLWIFLALAANIINILYRLKNNQINCTRNDKLVLTLLVIGLLAHDVASMCMAVAYTIHCQLAIVFVQNLQMLVRDGKISLLAFYKGTCEATCTIRQVNGLQSTAVFLQTVWLLISTLASIVGFVQSIDSEDYLRLSVAIISVLVWGSLLVVPLGQAARLSEVCNGIRDLGRELRSRPLVYQDTSLQELDSLVLFTASFNLTAELCSVRITKERLTLCCLVVAVIIYGSAHFDLLHF